MAIPVPFTAQAMQVGRLLANPYVIEAPSYQRSFAWSEDEAGQLLDDVSSAMDGGGGTGGHYFLGTMLFLKRELPPASRLSSWSRSRGPEQLEVVDGFQRLTTLTILFSVLRDLSGDDRASDGGVAMAIGSGAGARARHRLTLKGAADAFFQTHVRAPGATRRPAMEDTESQVEKRILAVRDHFISALQDQDEADRRKLSGFLLESCYVVHVATSDIDSAHRMFMVLNTRGKPLGRNDILKADLLGQVPEAARQSTTAMWDEAERRLDNDFEQLFSHIRSMYGRHDDQVIAGIHKVTEEAGGAQAFVERVLQPAVDVFARINGHDHAGVSTPSSIGRRLRFLKWHSFSDWIPPAMLWWHRHGGDTAGLESFLARLDRLAFAVRILGIGGAKRARRFALVVAAIRRGEIDAHDSPLELPRPDLKKIQHHLRDLHERNPTAARHLLFRLAEHQSGKPLLPEFPGDMTVEHVLPRKLPQNSPWRRWFQDPEERGACTESLGNLVLVTKKQNDLASNLDLGRKLNIYFNTPDAPVPSINEDLRGRTQWTPADVKAREARLMALLEEVWSLGLGRLGAPTPEPSTKPRSGGRRAKKP